MFVRVCFQLVVNICEVLPRLVGLGWLKAIRVVFFRKVYQKKGLPKKTLFES